MKQAKRLMVIDDHELILLGLRLVLDTSENYRIVHESVSGDEAWDYIKVHHQDIDIVLSDISLPGMDGLQLCSKIKQEYHHMLVIMYSINESYDVLQDSISAGANGFIKKGSSKEDLLTTLSKIVYTGTNFPPELLFEHRMQAKRDRQKPKLTSRERQILELITKEYTSEEIARELNLKKSTIDTHRSNMMQKFDVKSTLGLIVEAMGLKI